MKQPIRWYRGLRLDHMSTESKSWMDRMLEDVVTHGATFMGYDINGMTIDQLRRALVYTAQHGDSFSTTRHHDPSPPTGLRVGHVGKDVVARRMVDGKERIARFSVLRSTADALFFEIAGSNGLHVGNDLAEWVANDYFDKVGVLED